MSNLAHNPVLAGYYADMNDREEAAKMQEALQEQEREAAAARQEAIAAVSWHYTHAEDDEISIEAAIAALAKHFHNPDPSLVDADGASMNALAFQQRGFLGNMVQNAVWMLENAHKYENELWVKLDQIEATMRSAEDEIGTRNMEKVAAAIERAKFVQKPAIEAWLNTLKAAHEAILGEEWKPRAKTGARPAQQNASAVASRVAALRDGRRPQ